MTIVVESNDGRILISSQTTSWISLCRLFKMEPPVLFSTKLAIEGEVKLELLTAG